MGRHEKVEQMEDEEGHGEKKTENNPEQIISQTTQSAHIVLTDLNEFTVSHQRESQELPQEAHIINHKLDMEESQRSIPLEEDTIQKNTDTAVVLEGGNEKISMLGKPENEKEESLNDVFAQIS